MKSCINQPVPGYTVTLVPKSISHKKIKVVIPYFSFPTLTLTNNKVVVLLFDQLKVLASHQLVILYHPHSRQYLGSVLKVPGGGREEDYLVLSSSFPAAQCSLALAAASAGHTTHWADNTARQCIAAVISGARLQTLQNIN